MTIAQQPSHPQGSLGIETRSGLFFIRIRNPAHRNALTLSMWTALGEQVEAASRDDEVRAIVLQGGDDQTFSSGADISEFKSLRTTPEQTRHYDECVHRAHLALIQSAKPTVALIQGICMGGGMEIAAACDLRYGADSARFSLPASRLGLGYSLQGIERMVNIMGAASTADIFMTARTFDGREGARLGFLNEVFSDQEFATHALRRVETLADNAPLTIRAIKMALQNVQQAPGCPTAQEVDACVKACFASSDYQEGRQAFLEKRKPVFRGR
jgi:enoyl-CoA hydratase/carnithine racemase